VSVVLWLQLSLVVMSPARSFPFSVELTPLDAVSWLLTDSVGFDEFVTLASIVDLLPSISVRLNAPVTLLSVSCTEVLPLVVDVVDVVSVPFSSVSVVVVLEFDDSPQVASPFSSFPVCVVVVCEPPIF
jgi:hypothetical protein